MFLAGQGLNFNERTEDRNNEQRRGRVLVANAVELRGPAWGASLSIRKQSRRQEGSRGEDSRAKDRITEIRRGEACRGEATSLLYVDGRVRGGGATSLPVSRTEVEGARSHHSPALGAAATGDCSGDLQSRLGDNRPRSRCGGREVERREGAEGGGV